MKNDIGICFKKTLVRIKLTKLIKETEKTIANLVFMFPESAEKMDKVEHLMPERFKKIDLEIKNLERILKASNKNK